MYNNENIVYSPLNHKIVQFEHHFYNPKLKSTNQTSLSHGDVNYTLYLLSWQPEQSEITESQ